MTILTNEHPETPFKKRTFLKIFVHPIDAVGHYNACIGLAQQLAQRGHRIYFLSDSSLARHFTRYGFEERLLYQNVTKGNSTAIEQLSTKLYQAGLFDRGTSLQKAILLCKEDTFFDDIYRKCSTFNEQIRRWIAKDRPDLFIIDNFVIEPAILHSGLPWITVFSCNPLSRYQSDRLPPYGSGYAMDSDRKLWHKFNSIVEPMYAGVALKIQNKLLRDCGYPELNVTKLATDRHWITNKYLTVYGYPEELDYWDVVGAPPENYIRVDTFCRQESTGFELPKKFDNDNDILIYLSMGSMGSTNVDLMTRLVKILAQTDHKYIVSKGPKHREYELGDNMWGDEYVPQTSILPLVDLVITHGGNNTVTETFSFGKPMIVMPLFADQFDNAQRIQEKGFGIRLDPFDFEDKQLVESIDQLLNNHELIEKLGLISKRIRQSNSKEKAAIRIEQIAQLNQIKLNQISHSIKSIQ